MSLVTVGTDVHVHIYDNKMNENLRLVDTDTIFKALGQLGRFQLKQLIVTLLSLWSSSFHVLSIVFLGNNELLSKNS